MRKEKCKDCYQVPEDGGDEESDVDTDRDHLQLYLPHLHLHGVSHVKDIL